ncbi:MOSC domain-containing protein [Halomonas garicola]|uniref:MOSC domain-containing protein n=1 Tax=Halomonas garicola TaxID=1690008 RepID=UPI002897808B|nr:MOSC N-terminal beta barrel domain-containing protein [Halomonas garicola]
MRVEQLYCYPVKSLQGMALSKACVTACGLAMDRRWMLVDAQQRFVTQRQRPALATVGVALTDEALVLSHPRCEPLSVPLEMPPGRKLRVVSVWQDQCKAYPESEAVSRWLQAALGEAGQGLSLVRFAPEFPRAVEPDFLGGETAHTHFADGYPFLVTATGSLNRLNDALEARGRLPVPMSRFRPNIVVRTEDAWAEDGWQHLETRDGRLGWTLRKPSQRCKVTTVDQTTAEIPAPGEPLKTLLELDSQPHLKGAHFGQNATLTRGDGEWLRVGERLCEPPPEGDRRLPS